MGAFECSKISPTESTEVFTISVASTATLNEPRKDVESQIMKTGWRNNIWWRLGIDLPILIILMLLICLFELGVIPNHQAGFYCNSTILSYPFTGDTVTSDVLMSTFFIMPLVAILLTEYIFVEPEFPQSRIRLSGQNTLYLYGVFLYGFILNLGIVEVMKGVVGNPRPDFFALCDPDTAKTCTGSEYVSSFTCTKNQYSSWLQLDSYRSFPSGHSSLSVYCGFFIAWYLQRRAFNYSHRTILLVPVLQLACISYAAICSLTRITDHRHHWWDVLAGTGIGIATLLYAVAISANFSTDRNISDLKSQESRRTERTLLYDERRRTTE